MCGSESEKQSEKNKPGRFPILLRDEGENLVGGSYFCFHDLPLRVNTWLMRAGTFKIRGDLSVSKQRYDELSYNSHFKWMHVNIVFVHSFDKPRHLLN